MVRYSGRTVIHHQGVSTMKTSLSLLTAAVLAAGLTADDTVIPVQSIQVQGERTVQKCDQGSSNILSDNMGTLLGGVAGGVAGSQFGKGSGKTAATAIGAIAGAYAGKKIQDNMGTATQTAQTNTNCPQVIEKYTAYRNTATIPVGKTKQTVSFETDQPIANLRLVK